MSNGLLSCINVGDHVFVGGGDGMLKKMIGNDLDWVLEMESRLSGPITNLTVSANGTFLLAGTSSGRIYRVE